MSANGFRVNDKIICVDSTDDYGPFGQLPNHIELGKTYVVHSVRFNGIRGPILQVGPNTLHGYEARHFRLVLR